MKTPFNKYNLYESELVSKIEEYSGNYIYLCDANILLELQCRETKMLLYKALCDAIKYKRNTNYIQNLIEKIGNDELTVENSRGVSTKMKSIVFERAVKYNNLPLCKTLFDKNYHKDIDSIVPLIYNAILNNDDKMFKFVRNIDFKLVDTCFSLMSRLLENDHLRTPIFKNQNFKMLRWYYYNVYGVRDARNATYDLENLCTFYGSYEQFKYLYNKYKEWFNVSDLLIHTAKSKDIRMFNVIKSQMGGEIPVSILNTLMYAAILYGNLEIVQYLHETYHDINFNEDSKWRFSGICLKGMFDFPEHNYYVFDEFHKKYFNDFDESTYEGFHLEDLTDFIQFYEYDEDNVRNTNENRYDNYIMMEIEHWAFREKFPYDFTEEFYNYVINTVFPDFKLEAVQVYKIIAFYPVEFIRNFLNGNSKFYQEWDYVTIIKILLTRKNIEVFKLVVETISVPKFLIIDVIKDYAHIMDVNFLPKVLQHYRRGYSLIKYIRIDKLLKDYKNTPFKFNIVEDSIKKYIEQL
jgi:hypothetical protein